MYKTAASQAACIIICGPPGAGKTTYARKNMKRGDAIVDLDIIFSAISGLPMHDKPESLLSLALSVHHAAIARLALMGIDRPRTWIIGGLPTRQERQVLKNAFTNSRVIAIIPEQWDCLARIQGDPFRKEFVGEFRRIIEDWYENYEPEREESEEVSDDNEQEFGI